MKNTDKAWQRLISAARQVPQNQELGASYGLATRIAATAFERNQPAMSLMERFSMKALVLSCLLAVLGIVGNYSVIAQATNVVSEDALFTVDDPAEIVLGASTNE